MSLAKSALSCARPYAAAAYYWAEKTNTVGEWQLLLAVLEGLLQDTALAAVIQKSAASDVLERVIFDAIQTEMQLSEPAQNFVKLLLENHQFYLIPQITREFQHLHDATTGTVVVTLTLPAELKKRDKEVVNAMLERHWDTKVRIIWKVDPKLYSGITFQLKDLILDYSANGRLQALKAELML